MVLGLLLSGNGYSKNIIVCDNDRDGQDTTAVAIDNKKKYG